MDRQPYVAGRFYDADADKLNGAVDAFLSLGEQPDKSTVLCMVPHAGYVFSGGVCGQTLAQSNLEQTLLLLGPNHTGVGTPFSLWPGGTWHVPGAQIAVDMPLSHALLDCSPEIEADSAAHLQEHSLEVLLPFLHRLNPATTIAPLAIAASSLSELEQVGRAMGKMLKDFDRPVSIVVSSDMSHFISHEAAKKQDARALEAAVSLDPVGLFETVRSHQISMCGVRPMTAGLFAALELGANQSELIAYSTSGEVSGDFDSVVGYAGIVVS